ncbi:MAG: hypothetical protein JWQ11_4040, partial [Rhizobacter sp.]|nr:hypothetical protein [Rhizobacter sp.]
AMNAGGHETSFSTLLSQSAARTAASASARAVLPSLHAATASASQQASKAPQAQPPRPSTVPPAKAEKPASPEQAAVRPPIDGSGGSRAGASNPGGTTDASADATRAAEGDTADAADKVDKVDTQADGKTDATQADPTTADPKSMQARLRLAKQASDARSARAADDTSRPDHASRLHGTQSLKGQGRKLVADGDSAEGSAHAASSKEKTTGTDASPIADLHAWLAANTLPPGASEAGKADAAAGKSASDTSDAINASRAAGLGGLPGNAGLPGSQDMADDPRNAGVATSAVELTAGQLLQAMEEGVGRAMESFGKQLVAASANVPGLEGVAAAAAVGRPSDAFMNSGSTSASDVPPPEFTLATPVDAPDFTQSLGVQVSLMARDGIGEAKLHLNPAEMGPIAISIVMDGSQARVDFTAASAETRHILEAGLPELASAMKEAGVTLSGGGVFDPPSQSFAGQPGRDQSGEAQASRSGARLSSGRDAGESSSDAAAVVRRTATLSRGGVDTYA